jgi:hypothetical protein
LTEYVLSQRIIADRTLVTNHQTLCCPNPVQNLHCIILWPAPPIHLLSNILAKISNESKCALSTLQGRRRGFLKVSFYRWSHAASVLMQLVGVIDTLIHFSRNSAIASILQLVAERPCSLHALHMMLGSHAQQLWSSRGYRPWEGLQSTHVSVRS